MVLAYLKVRIITIVLSLCRLMSASVSFTFIEVLYWKFQWNL